MNTRILERYRKSGSGDVVLDITASRVEDLYNNFDRQAPYVIKDLDSDLVEYITESARELGNMPFVICFNLAIPCDEDTQSRVRSSISNYFLYMHEVEQRKLHISLRTTVLFMILGISIMFLSVLVNQNFDIEGSVTGSVFAEGLTVAAWVALWQAIANLLIDWWPARKLVMLYKTISHINVEFSQQ